MRNEWNNNDELVVKLFALATYAEKANHWTDDKRLMDAAGVADVIHEGVDRIEELEAKLAKALDTLKNAAREHRVIAGMDMIGASATAYNAAREAEAAIKELTGEAG